MSVPVVIVGNSEQLAAPAIKYLAPEYDGTYLNVEHISYQNPVTNPSTVVAFLENLDEAPAQIQALINGEPVDTTLGSKKFGQPIQAVIVGGTVGDARFDAIHKAVGSAPVSWLKYDASKPEPAHTPEGGAQLIARIKEAFGAAQVGQVVPY